MAEYITKNIRNIVLLGHGSTGNTSLVEAMLYRKPREIPFVITIPKRSSADLPFPQLWSILYITTLRST